MKSRIPQADAELDALLEQGRFVPRVSEVVRTRSLSRARATMAAMAALPREPLSTVRRRGLTIALAASLAMAVGAAVATAALLGRSPSPNQPAPPAVLHSERTMRTSEVPAASPSIAPPTPITVRPQRWVHPTTVQESYAAELDLLARAQVAYVAREFADVLARVAEHARKFPNGRLAEEREALRVRALEGSGHLEEAHRAAAAFAARFPRSIMLPRLSGEPR